MTCVAILVAAISISETAFLLSEHREHKTPLIGQFEGIEFAKVWNDLKSNKVVSYTVARDLTQVRQYFYSFSSKNNICSLLQFN